MNTPDETPGDNAAPGRWLAIIGIGEDGLEGLNPTAIRLIEAAEVVFGGRRHLALAASAISGEAHPWPTPFDIDDVLVLRGRPVVVLASGDPFHYGVGPLLTQAIPSNELQVIPAPSSFSLAAARLGWPLAETVLLSLHGRPIDLIRPHLQPGAAILALTSDGEAPAAIAALVAEAGFGPSQVAVLEALGGPDERLRATTAASFDLDEINPLNLLGILVAPAPGARIVPLVSGLPDAMYAHDGQITKQPIRAMTLAALAPRRGERLWDIGAGSGAIAIEWMLADRSLRAIAVEANAERAERIAHNAAVLGVPDLLILHGHAPTALEGLDLPDAVFLGCGAADSELVDAALAALRPGGRLVVNAVTIASEAALLALHAVLGGTLTRVSIAHAETLGSGKGWRPAMPITQWAWTKP
jgi:precorrin-6Y C5,15-methyltransferase (decarboxylating)